MLAGEGQGQGPASHPYVVSIANRPSVHLAGKPPVDVLGNRTRGGGRGILGGRRGRGKGPGRGRTRESGLRGKGLEMGGGVYFRLIVCRGW